MSPLFWALLVSMAVSCVLAMGFVWQLERNAELRDSVKRARRGEPNVITSVPLARDVSKPAAWRRRS